MARRLKIDRPTPLTIQMPASIHAKIMEQLYSDIEGRVPFGALSALGEVLFTDWLRERGVEV